MTARSSRRSPSSGRHWEAAEIAPNATYRCHCPEPVQAGRRLPSRVQKASPARGWRYVHENLHSSIDDRLRR